MKINLSNDELELLSDGLGAYLKLYKTFLNRGEPGFRDYENRVFQLLDKIGKLQQPQEQEIN
jgi:hypothetical protein